MAGNQSPCRYMIRSIIVAVADDMSIGRDNALMWHLRGDMKFFRETTTGHPVIMGRKTFESIGKALPGRLNIVISRSMEGREDLKVASSLEEAFALAGQSGADECFVMGGGTVYRQALPLADRLYVTLVHTVVPDADTFFPEIDPGLWEEEWSSDTFEEEGLKYVFKRYKRKV